MEQNSSKADIAEIENCLQSSKWLFFNKALMLVGADRNEVCRIADIEFYQGADPYLITDPHLSTTMTFYFARKRAKKAGVERTWTYRKGKYTALYITCGNANISYRAAVLITALSTPSGYIAGASNVVSYILNYAGVKSVTELLAGTHANQIPTNQIPVSCDNNHFLIRLVDAAYEPCRIYNGPRQGLTLKKEKDISHAEHGKYLRFLMKELRFICMPQCIKKNKHLLAVSARMKGVPDDTIISDFKLPIGALGRWITQFLKGKIMHHDMLLSRENKLLAEINIQLNAFGLLSN